MNEEHYEILKKGIAKWNKWRDQNQNILPNLMGADLNNKDLSEFNLSFSNLRGAILYNVKLVNANLSHANLSHSILNGARLNSANISYADLFCANLRDSNLSNCILHGASLNEVNLSGAILKNADFHLSKLSFTIFAFNILTNVKNINTCIHQSSSSIDHYTLSRSEGLPIEFLRGVGLPEVFINEYSHLFLDNAIEYYSCFISYSNVDKEFAERIYSDLQNKGIRCWFAPEDLKIGDKIRASLDEAIKLHDKLLLILSENSINSDWVETEVEKAFAKESNIKTNVLFPVRLDDTAMNSDKAWVNDIKITRNIGDFTRWKNHDSYKKTFDRLLRDLKQG